MAKVIVSLTVSLDGFIAGPGDGIAHPLGENGNALFEWYFNGDTPSQQYGERFRLSKQSAEVFDAGIASGGAVVTGRRTYDISGGWGGDSPLPGRPVFVLTHRPPRRPPATSVPHTFVTDGIESAIGQAKKAAAGRYVALMGSRAPQQCLAAGLLDEIQVAQVPLLLGRGVRLFAQLASMVRLEIVRVTDAPHVTHIRYRVVRGELPLPCDGQAVGDGQHHRLQPAVGRDRRVEFAHHLGAAPCQPFRCLSWIDHVAVKQDVVGKQ
jgi:dihydrofolate reductase